MDVPAVVEGLNAVLARQHRSALAFSLVAGSLTGFEFRSLTGELVEFAHAELADARRLVEKIAALEGTPTTDVGALEHHDDPEAALRWLVEVETEAIEALKPVITSTGQEGRSEALEHRLEHVIMRKQEQVDTLLRTLRRPA